MANKYRRLIASLYQQPWLLDPDKMQQVIELLELRRSGGRLTDDEIQSRIATRRENYVDQPRAGGIAVISLIGVHEHRMAKVQNTSGRVSLEAFNQMFTDAVEDDAVGTIVLDIDSPGGSTYGAQETADLIYAGREKKKVIAVANDVAGSGAYWIASQASELVVTPGGEVGSIGVFGVHIDTSDEEKKAGRKVQVIRAGQFKAEGFEGPLSAEALTHRQQQANEIYAAFQQAVARGRGVSVATIEADFGQGRSFRSDAALKLGMVDRVATLDQVISELRGDSSPSAARADVRASADSVPFQLKVIDMDKRVLEALVKRDLCSVDASDDQVQTTLTTFFAGRGENVPEKVEDIVSALAKQPQAAAAQTPVATADPPAATYDFAGDVMNACKMAVGLEDPFAVADDLIQRKVPLQAALREIQEKQAQASQQADAGATDIRPGAAAADKFTAEARDTLLCRMWPASQRPRQIHDVQANGMVDWKPSPQAQAGGQLGNLPRLAEECLVMDGYDRRQLGRLNSVQVAQLIMGKNPRDFGLRAAADGPAYNQTGMFSNIMYDASNVTLRNSYNETPVTYTTWAKQGPSATDFKQVHRVIAGELGDPTAIPEDGEFDESTHVDAKEAYRLVVWGQVFSITWQAVVNDQLSAFTEIPAKQGVAMRRKQNKLVYDVLLTNPTMADSGALFNTTAITSAGGHNNLATGAGAPSVSTLNALAKKMAEMTGLNTAALTFLNIQPKFIISCPDLAGTIGELLGSPANPAAGGSAAGSSGVVNIWQNGLTPVIDAQLGAFAGGSDTAWYLAADPNVVDTIEYAFLQGLETPQMEQQMAFDRLAMRRRIYQPFIAHAMDFRGLQKHAGA